MTHVSDEAAEGSATAPPQVKSSFAVLFVTDIWERFGFYAMTAVLALFASAPVAQGGLGWSRADAAALFSVWLALTFMLSLPGGWFADRVLGARRSLVAGGIVSTCGFLMVAGFGAPWNLCGLLVVAAGTGLYKPSHQTMFSLIITSRERRESGISLLYVAIQISALLAPLIAGYLGEVHDWRLAFLTAAVTTFIGLVTLLIAGGRFGSVGKQPPRPLSAIERQRVQRRSLLGAGALLAVLVVLAGIGQLRPTTVLILVGLLTIVVPVLAYTALYRNPRLEPTDRRNLLTFLLIFTGWTMFWMLVGQGGSVLNLFARDSTDRDFFGFIIPASWLQSATPLFILLIAPMFAWLLPRIGQRAVSPGAYKLTLGLLIAGASFLVMSVGSALAMDGTKVSPVWLLVVYLSHACGELIIAAVGVAAVVEALPKEFMSQMLGLLWLFAALGGGVGSQVVRLAEVLPQPVYFIGLGLVVSSVALLVSANRRRIASALPASGARA